jgi:hypothetical protein
MRNNQDPANHVVMERTPIKTKSLFKQFGQDEEEREIEDEAVKENSPTKQAIARASVAEFSSVKVATPRHSSIAPVKEMGKRFDKGPALMPKSSFGFVPERSGFEASAKLIDPQELKLIGKSVYERVAAEAYGSPKKEEGSPKTLRSEKEILESILRETSEGTFYLLTFLEAAPVVVESRFISQLPNIFLILAFLSLAVSLMASSDLSFGQQVVVEWESAVAAAPVFLKSAEISIQESAEWVEITAMDSWAEIVARSVEAMEFMKARSSASYSSMLEHEYTSIMIDKFVLIKGVISEFEEVVRERTSELHILGLEKMDEFKNEETVASVISMCTRMGNDLNRMVTDLNMSLEMFLISMTAIVAISMYLFRLMSVRKNAEIVYVSQAVLSLPSRTMLSRL